MTKTSSRSTATDLLKVLEGEVGSRRPEALNAGLSSGGADWYVSEVGDLFVQWWQPVVEGFVTGADIDQMRKLQPDRQEPEMSNLAWFSQHRSELRQKYTGRWIAIVDGAVVADAPEFQSLLEKTPGLDRPFVVEVRDEPPPRKMTFGHQIV